MSLLLSRYLIVIIQGLHPILTNKQSKFIEAYKLLNDPTKAAISAGYSAKSAAVEGNRLLKSAKIIYEIDIWRKERQKNISREDFTSMALNCFNELEVTEPNKPRFLDLAGKALRYTTAEVAQSVNNTLNITQINMDAAQPDMWAAARKLIGND